MVIECCSQERSYSNFYGLIGERFCKLNRVWCENFEQAFANYYETIHRYETNRLRNIGRFFGHLVASDAVSWGVFHAVKMNEEDTTSSSRIFIKILMTEMMESMGVKKIAERFAEPSMQGAFQNIFPLGNPRDTRFSINYFTSIGLGAVTERMREHLTVCRSPSSPCRLPLAWSAPRLTLSPPSALQNMPKIIMEQRQKALEAASSDSDSSSSSSSDSSDSSSDSDSSSGSSRSRSYSRSPARRDTRRRSSTPPPARRRRYSDSRSPSPVGRREQRRRSSTPPVRRERSPSPVRRGGRLPSPVRRGGRSPSPVRRGGRSPSPVRRGGRSPSPIRRGGRSRSPVRRGPGPGPGYGGGAGGGGVSGYGGGPGYGGGGGRGYDSRPLPPHLQQGGGSGGGRGRSPSPVRVRRNEPYPDQRARPRADSRDRRY
jgi:pre-mRNA-splicing factor CWC22